MRVTLVLLAALCGVAHAQTGATNYSIIAVPAPPLSGAAGLNSEGDVFGNTILGHSAAGFLVSGGEPASVFTGAGVEFAGINDSDQIVGKVESCCTSQVYAFEATGETVTNLGVLGSPEVLNTYSGANAINNSGQVVGDSYIAPGQGPTHGFLYRGGLMSDLGTVGGAASSAQAINNHGQITGTAQSGNGDFHAFLFSDGFMFDLGLFGVYSSAVAINDNGEILILGQMNSSPTRFPELFVYQSGKTTDLGPIGLLLGLKGIALNNYGQIVGSDISGHAFIYANGTFTDLNTLIPADAGWVLQNAVGINDSGQIAGNGLLNGVYTPYLLTPVPLAPSCQISSIVAGPPKQLNIAMQDAGSGLQSIQLTESANSTVNIPVFSPGTTSPVIVTAVKADQSQSSTVAFQVVNMAGNSTSCDPVDFTVKLEGLTERHAFRSLNGSEHYVRIVNGNPGLSRVAFRVNGALVPSVDLMSGQTRVLDFGSNMHPGADNRVLLEAAGARGSSASVLIGDSSVK
jgi:probable HAF family extracellular repeat protein